MTLHLTLKRRWFSEILAGHKTEEYREDKPYWQSRLCYGFTRIRFTNGYGRNAPRMTVECLGIDNKELVIEGLSGGKARRYFVIKLGRVLSTANLDKIRPARCRLYNKVCKTVPCQYAGGRGCRRTK